MIRAFTDTGNAERFIAEHSERVRYVLGSGWHNWDGRRWQRDDAGAVTQLAIGTAKGIVREREFTDDPDVWQGIDKWSRQSQMAGKIRAMLELAQTFPAVVIDHGRLDADPYLFSVANKTINLRTGQPREHRMVDLISKLAPIEVDPTATAPNFDAFLHRISNNNAEWESHAQRRLGSCLVAGNQDRKFVVLHGGGANGKSTLIAVIAHILGDYAVYLDPETFFEKRNDSGIPNDLARLRGVRLLIITESKQGRRLDEDKIKRLTGGVDKITARFLHREWFEFLPEFTPFLTTNHKPGIRGTDEGIWDRIELVPFSVRIPEAERDPSLLDKLKSEFSGILNWLIEGCRAWQREGVKAPACVQDANAEYRRDSDVLGDLFDEKLAIDEGARTPASELYSCYAQYAESRNEKVVSQKVFGQMLTERGFQRNRNNGIQYRGLRLRTPDDDAAAVTVFQAVLTECRNLGIKFHVIDGGADFQIIGDPPSRLSREIEQHSARILEFLNEAKRGQVA